MPEGGSMLQQISVLAVLGICSYEDIKNKRIHAGWLAVFAAVGVLLWILEGKRGMAEALLAILPGLFVLLLAFGTRGGIGEGDGVLLMTIGIFLGGADVLQIFVYALFLAGCYALFLFLIKKKGRKYEIAFVPFLLLAYLGTRLL